MCVCVHGCEREKGINTEGGGRHHLCIRPFKYPCTIISVVVIAKWPTEGVLLIFITSAGSSLWCVVYYSAWGVCSYPAHYREH